MTKKASAHEVIREMIATVWPTASQAAVMHAAADVAETGMSRVPTWPDAERFASDHQSDLEEAFAPRATKARKNVPAPRLRAGERPLDEVILLTVAEVAAVMRVSKMTVYRLVHSGHLPAIRVGRSFRIPERAVHDYLQESYIEIIAEQ